MDLEFLMYPIGKYTPNKTPSLELLDQWINEIELFPSRLKALTQNLSHEELNWKYRPKGWKIKQVIHHCADSHMNSIIRFKLALTENTPEIRPYFEDRWANLSDSLSDDITDSMLILKGLHIKWGMFLRNLSAQELKREFKHPEQNQPINLAENIGLYAWHSNHHLAHIKNAIKSKGAYN